MAACDRTPNETATEERRRAFASRSRGAAALHGIGAGAALALGLCLAPGCGEERAKGPPLPYTPTALEPPRAPPAEWRDQLRPARPPAPAEEDTKAAPGKEAGEAPPKATPPPAQTK
jgi:hypothetical protein